MRAARAAWWRGAAGDVRYSDAVILSEAKERCI
jgi:hypothetical protein